jgi:lipopolysaccharide/colanic/teichoic acid biosynthesis glycosyltransferase
MENETTLGLPKRRPTAWPALHRLDALPAITRDRAREARPPQTENPTAPEGAAAAAEFVRLDEAVLPRAPFLRDVQRECRRADRSKSPLSVVVFRPDEHRIDDFDRVEGLIGILRRTKRETDLLGDLGDHVIAMMLPDTSPDGLKRFVARVGGDVEELGYVLVPGTYPDDVFHDLLRRGGEAGPSQPLFVDERRDPDRWDLLVKRLIDVAVAGVALMMLAPLMLIVAVAIAITSPGPVIFRQIRLGKGGRPFVFYKFRSMTANADDRIHREYVSGLIATAPEDGTQDAAPRTWSKLPNDPRITPVGRVIRKTSIDELPQLFNVLIGDLSLIGPRPALPYEAEKYQSWHLRRILCVKPGVSGLWQVAAGYNATFDDMVRLDLRYMREWSLLLDLKILVKTVEVVLRRSGTG